MSKILKILTIALIASTAVGVAAINHSYAEPFTCPTVVH